MYYQPVQLNNLLKIPSWCYEDTPIDYDYIEDEEIFVRVIDQHEVQIDYQKYRDLRKTTYFACCWYSQLIDADIPTIPSLLIKSSIMDLRADLTEHFQDQQSQFVRLCGSSPKDVHLTCIFNNAKNAANTLMRSNRTLNIMQTYNHCHLFLRKVVNLLNESRCIVHERQVRAVSVYQKVVETEKAALEKSVTQFFEKYGEDLPSNSAVIELGWENNYHSPFIIEINSFGVDGWAGASLFDWDSESWLLYHSEKPVLDILKDKLHSSEFLSDKWKSRIT
jgi:hypothetical protein